MKVSQTIASVCAGRGCRRRCPLDRGGASALRPLSRRSRCCHSRAGGVHVRVHRRRVLRRRHALRLRRHRLLRGRGDDLLLRRPAPCGRSHRRRRDGDRNGHTLVRTSRFTETASPIFVLTVHGLLARYSLPGGRTITVWAGYQQESIIPPEPEIFHGNPPPGSDLADTVSVLRCTDITDVGEVRNACPNEHLARDERSGTMRFERFALVAIAVLLVCFGAAGASGASTSPTAWNPARGLLIEGATVVTMDDRIPSFRTAGCSCATGGSWLCGPALSRRPASRSPTQRWSRLGRMSSSSRGSERPRPPVLRRARPVVAAGVGCVARWRQGRRRSLCEPLPVGRGRLADLLGGGAEADRRIRRTSSAPASALVSRGR